MTEIIDAEEVNLTQEGKVNKYEITDMHQDLTPDLGPGQPTVG